VYLGHVIAGGELKIDPMKMEAILRWPVSINVIEVGSFGRFGYLGKWSPCGFGSLTTRGKCLYHCTLYFMSNFALT
jgi:hypothetical protein